MIFIVDAGDTVELGIYAEPSKESWVSSLAIGPSSRDKINRSNLGGVPTHSAPDFVDPHDFNLQSRGLQRFRSLPCSPVNIGFMAPALQASVALDLDCRPA